MPLALSRGSAVHTPITPCPHLLFGPSRISRIQVVALRNLNTVVSLRRDGDPALLWTLSSSLDSSDFEFENDAARFYQPHSVSQLPNGNILLIDDGNDRPGCDESATDHSYSGCFSRAIMYRLDAMGEPPLSVTHCCCEGAHSLCDTHTVISTCCRYRLNGTVASVAWQFAYPVLVSSVSPGTNASATDGTSSSSSSPTPTPTSGSSSSSSSSPTPTPTPTSGGATKTSRPTVWKERRPTAAPTAAPSAGGDSASASRRRTAEASEKQAQVQTTLARAQVQGLPTTPAGRRGLGATSDATLDAVNLQDVFVHDAFNWDGGTVTRLSNGNFLVGLTAVVESRAWNPQGSMLLFEVDETGEAVALMELPRPEQSDGMSDGGYRTLPWASVQGESSVSPFT